MNIGDRVDTRVYSENSVKKLAEKHLTKKESIGMWIIIVAECLNRAIMVEARSNNVFNDKEMSELYFDLEGRLVSQAVADEVDLADSYVKTQVQLFTKFGEMANKDNYKPNYGILSENKPSVKISPENLTYSKYF